MSDNTIMTGYLKVILGCMFSGKTTELIKEYNRHKACDIRSCFVNHSADDRYGSGTSTTKTASFNTDGTDGKIKYTSVDGDFNEVGTWRIQAKVVMGGGTFRSDVGTFKVHENL